MARDPRSGLGAMLNTFDDGSTSVASKIFRVTGRIGLVLLPLGIILTNGTFNGQGPWWDVLGEYFTVAGFFVALSCALALGLLSNKRSRNDPSTSKTAAHTFKMIALFMYLPAIVIGLILLIIFVLPEYLK